MPHLAKILPQTNVLLDLDVSSKSALLEHASTLLEGHCGIAFKTVFDSLQARESAGSTGLGRGVAVPHGRVKGLKGAMAAFIRLKEPIPFDSPDDQPVKLAIVVLIPDNVTQQHLEILSEIAEMFSNESFRTMLSTEPEAATIHAKILAWKPGRQTA